MKISSWISEYLEYLSGLGHSERHYKKLFLYGQKLSKSIYFFTYSELHKVKQLFKNDGYYKALKGMSRFLSEKYHDNSLVLAELEKIRRVATRPKSKPDLYTPTKVELQETLDFLKKDNKVYYLVYLGLKLSGVRITELVDAINNRDKYRIIKEEGFQKIVLNTSRNTKSAYFIYLPLDYEFPEKVNLGQFRTYVNKHKQIIRPKYLRNFFYKRCIELSIPAAIADFYQGRVPIRMGDKHYLEKEKLADDFYLKLLGN